MASELLDEKAIFNVARNIDSPSARAEYLRQVCGANRGLLEQVETLLRAYEEQESFLESPPGGSPPTIEQSILENPGTQIGPYKLLQQIGEGGMGVVYMAEQTEPVKRRVALKIIKPGMDTRQVIARFEAERQALSLMDHPNIAKVLDAGTTHSSHLAPRDEALPLAEREGYIGRPYFVMELVKGQPITQYCDEHHLTPRQRLELFLPVCQAIQHAHQKGIIHRDIKPTNILVAEYDQQPVPKVIDFGVAKATSQALTEKTMFTGLGQIVGTLEYMSPEQAKVNQLDIDTRSDIYSLGVLLYELLTGSTPFDRQRLRSAAFDEMLRIIREEEPPKPSTRLSDSHDALPSISAQRHTEPAKLTKLVRGELDWIVMKALEKDRNRRYESANGFAADLQRYLADEPVQACPPSAWYRFRKFARRNKGALVTTAVLAVAVLVVAGTIGWGVRDRESHAQEAARERAARQTAVENEVSLALKEAEQLQEQAKWPEALSAAKRAQGMLAGSGSDELRERVNQLRKDLEMVLRLEGIRLLSSEWKDDKFDHETADRAYGQAFADYGIDIGGLAADEAAARIRERAGVAVALAAALDDWAFSRSRKDWAGGVALATLAQSADTDPWRRQVRQASMQKDTKALAALAASPEMLRQPPISLLFLSRVMRALSNAEAIIAVLRQAQRQYPGDFWINYNLATALSHLGPSNRDEAVSFYRAALAIRPQSGAVLNDLGLALHDQGKWDEAIAHFNKAIELDQGFVRAHTHLGSSLQALGKLDDAIASYRKAIELDPKNANAHLNLGIALRKQGRLVEASVHYGKAGDLDPKSAKARIGLGLSLFDQEKLSEAIDCFHKAIDLDPKSAEAQNGLGCALLDQKKVSEALDCFHKAIDLDPKSADAYLNLGNALHDQGKLDLAIAAYHKSIELDPKSARTYRVLGSVLQGQRKLNEAIAALRKAIELDPSGSKECAIAHSNLALALLDLTKSDEALVHVRRAIQLDPKNAHAYGVLGIVLNSQDKVNDAITAYRKAIELDPKPALVHSNLGLALLRKKKFEEAVNAFQKAIELDPKFARAHSILGDALSGQNKLDEAVAAYRRAVDLDPKDALIRRNLGCELLHQGKVEDAIAVYRKAIELDPESARGRDGLGEALGKKSWDLANHPDLKLGDLKRAVEVGKEAIEVAPQSGWAWQYLGWIQYRAGNWRASIEALDKSCALQWGGKGDCYQWIVLALAHAQLAAQEDLPKEERLHHRTEARRRYEQCSAKEIDAWRMRPSGTLEHSVWEFREEARKLIGPNAEKK